jgi:hypothetical protein
MLNWSFIARVDREVRQQVEAAWNHGIGLQK